MEAVPEEILLEIFCYVIGGEWGGYWWKVKSLASVCRRWQSVAAWVIRHPDPRLPRWLANPWDRSFGYFHQDLFRTRTIEGLQNGRWLRSEIRAAHDKAVLEDKDFSMGFLGCRSRDCPLSMSHVVQLKMQLTGLEVSDAPLWYVSFYYRLAVMWKIRPPFQCEVAQAINPSEVSGIFQSFFFDAKINARNEHYERLLKETRALQVLGFWELLELRNIAPPSQKGHRWFKIVLEAIRDSLSPAQTSETALGLL